MAITKQCFLVTLFLAATLFTGAIRGAEIIPKSDNPVPPTIITEKSTTVTTSTEPTLPTSPTTPSTKTTSTSTEASTTTVTTTVTPPTSSSTTVTPPSSTTPAPAPTPTPAPSKPVVGNWTVAEGNHTCAVFRAAITIDLAFNDKSNKTQHYNIYVPSNAKVEAVNCGIVGTANNQFSLVFPAGNVKMTFVQNNSHYYLQQVESWINATVLTDLIKQTNESIFSLTYTAEKDTMALEGSLNSSYVCASPAALKMNNGTLFQLASVTYQAFIKDGKLGPAQNCVTDNSPDMVPILVAGGLILFVVLVLVAYIVTRQRQARGYHSM